MKWNTGYTVMITFLLLTTMFSAMTLGDEKSDQQFDETNRAFHDYDSLTTELETIAATYPSITNLYELGQSVQGRSIWGLKITDNPDIEENEVEIQFEGCHHGNEYMSVEMPLNLAWLLVENYSVDPTITEYIDTREIWIVPLVNPDGREMSQRQNANDVDLNRDYGYMHGGSTPAPFSQPETQVMREHQLKNNMVLAYSYHTTAEYVNYVWDYKPQSAPDEPWIDYISQIYADYSGYTKTQGFDWYQTTGASDDGNYGCFGNINTIIETLNSNIASSWSRNKDAMLDMIYLAGMGISGVVSDALTGEPLRASVWVEEAYWPVFTDPVIGDYHKPLFEGTYHVHYRANGYEEQVQTITITDANASNIYDVALYPSDGYYGYQVTLCEYFDHNTNPTEGISALGPPDGVPASLGNNGMMIVDMGNTTPIVNGVDDDFTVIEADTDFEGYTVSVSQNWNGPWSSLGAGFGNTSFDLEDVGLESARFVKIEDDGSIWDEKDYPGFDLDAIKADAPFTPDHDIQMENLDIPSVVAHGETQTVTATIHNIGLYDESSITVDFKVNGTILDSTMIPSLDSAESTDVEFIWDPAIGSYVVAVESQPIPSEYDLTNNNANKTVDVIAAPAIDVTPGSFTFLVPTESSDVDTLTITNLASAEASLQYTITVDDNGDGWLSAVPLSGSITIDDYDEITVAVDTSGMTQGTYLGELILSSNDLDDPEVIIPVYLTVVYGNDMKVVSINNPTGVIPAGSYIVNATVQNIGSYPQTDVLVNCSIFEGGIGGTVLFEDFSTNPTDWTITSTDGTAWTWDSSDQRMEHSYGFPNTGYLDSPVLDCSAKTGLSLSFWHYWKADYSSAQQDGYVRGSIDGGTSFPYLVDEFHDFDPAEETAVKEYDISSWADGQSQVVIRFDIYNNNGWYWRIDDFNVSAEISGNIVYSSEKYIDVDQYETQYVEFNPAWNAGMGLYGIQISTLLPTDENTGNDVVAEVVSVEGPGLGMSPEGYDFGMIGVDQTESTSFEIWNDGVGTLTYSLSESESWLEVAPLSGDSTGEHDTIDVYVDTTGLTPGMSYHGDILISSDGGSDVFTVDMYVVSDTTEFIDVNQSVYDRGFPVRHAVDGDWAGAEDFTPTMGMISSVDLYLRKFGTPEFDLVVELREDHPEGTLLDTVTFTPGEVGTSWGWLHVDFTEIVVESGVDYFIVVPPAPSGVTTSFGYEWGYAFGDLYDGGSFWFTRDGGGLIQNIWADINSWNLHGH